jgi:hypothetical protein
MTSRLLEPMSLMRVAVLRTIIYLYVGLSVLLRSKSALERARDAASLWQPVDVLRILHQPAPSVFFIDTLRVIVIAGSCIAVTGRLPRLVGWPVALAYADLTCTQMSYGKVSHSYLALLVALFVLPTVSGARWSSTDSSESAGWSVRMIEASCVATYFLSALAKLRYSGPKWVTSSVFTNALIHDGTSIGRPLLHHATLLLLGQIGLFCFEILTPLIFLVPDKWRVLGVAAMYGFHVITWLTISITFAPLMICLPSLLPLDRYVKAIDPRRWMRAGSQGSLRALEG